jgi:hypothetical protein
VDASRPDDSGVATNWATAKHTIQAAIDLTVDGDTVWVTNGVYDTGGAIAPICRNLPYVAELSVFTNKLMNRVCITNGIFVRSVNGANATIIQGSSDNGTFGTNAVRCAYLLSGAVMDGFTLTGGYTFRFDLNLTQLDGYGGGALLISNAVLNCCKLVGNQAFSGGGAWCWTDCAMNNCLIVSNVAFAGGGAMLDHGTLNNCTIAVNACYSNYTNLSGGVWEGYASDIYISSGNLNNCIAFPDDPAGYYCEGLADQYYSCIPWTRRSFEGNIKTNPVFNDNASDFQLKTNSPCINAGNNGYVFGATDLNGNPRIIDGTVDMGAYEFYGAQDDYDSDGIPNGWAAEHFGGITRTDANAVCSNGVNTIRQAYVAGLDPNDPQSRFSFSVDTATFFGNILRWQSVSGREYSVYYSTNLVNGFTPLIRHLVTGEGAYIDEVYEYDGPRYYKIDVQIDNNPDDNVTPPMIRF